MPVAWVAQSARDETAPLLRWLDVREVRDHTSTAFADVAILDLPDVDSTTPEHRARVDELLPHVDAVVWVADPEKYRDAVLHDEYLRRWAPRLRRQLLVLNKADRVGAESERLREHLAASLRAEGIENVSVAVTSATRDGDARELRDWIVDGVEAKRVISERIAAELADASLDLARRAGVLTDAKPLITAEQRAQVLADVTREAAAIIDLVGLERQAVAATRLAARPRGAGPFGLVTTFLYRASGRDRVVADPEGYLRRWRERGTLARAAEPIRTLVSDLLPRVPAEARGAIASLIDAEALRARLTAAIDAAVATRTADVRAPTSFVWSVIGALQYVVTAGLLFAALWIAAVFLLHAPFASVDAPVRASPAWTNTEVGMVNGVSVLHAGSGRLDGSWHRQTSDEFLLVLEGELTVEFDAGPLSAGPGEAIHIAAGERHRASVGEGCLLLSVEAVGMKRTDG